MTDLLHWYARAHGPRAYRIVRAALDGGEAEATATDAATEPTAAEATPTDLTPEALPAAAR